MNRLKTFLPVSTRIMTIQKVPRLGVRYTSVTNYKEQLNLYRGAINLQQPKLHARLLAFSDNLVNVRRVYYYRKS